MTAQDFERKMNGLLMFVGSFKTDALFQATIQEMIHEVGLEQAAGGNPVVIMGRVGALQGILAAQTRWVEEQAERLIASGQAQRVYAHEARP